MDVPDDHPRAQSLRVRHKIIDGMKKLVVAEAGLIAQGRGEAWDYLIGEKTNENAIETMKAAVAMLLSAEHPVISVNGNVAALCPEVLVKLSETINAPLEINLFYRKPGRINAIRKVLEDAGATSILGTDENKKAFIEELSSNRRYVDPDGIKIADVVLVPLEDGDRTEALVKEGKQVIAVDLNPLNRTSQWSDISIIDNVVRALPKMIEIADDYKSRNLNKIEIKSIVEDFDNQQNLKNAINIVIEYLTDLGKEGQFLPIE